jgi:hypothetical protein
VQVWGSKTVRLYAPDQSQNVYPFANPFLRNTSQVLSLPQLAGMLLRTSISVVLSILL